ncbi:MAG: NUDIX hydrolase [Gammaproteobacteria bacterium]
MRWNPHVTVAALVEQSGKFLLVEERDGARIVYNQPAGHLEEGETLLDAVIRETREETARDFIPEALVGVYRYVSPGNGVTYLRFCFSGRCSEPRPGRQLDGEILRALWLDRESLLQRESRLRSPMVLRCIDDYRSGKHYPLALLSDLTAR